MINPCPNPKCKSGNIGMSTNGSGVWRVCVSCGMTGPLGISYKEADDNWKGLPRDPEYRSEPPDQPGWWFIARPVPGHEDSIAGSFTACLKYTEEWEFRDAKRNHRPGMMYAGPFQALPLPMPPAPDAEEESH